MSQMITINTRTQNANDYREYLASQGIIVLKEWQEDANRIFVVNSPPPGYTYDIKTTAPAAQETPAVKQQRAEQEAFRKEALASGTGQSIATINLVTGKLEGYETYTKTTTTPSQMTSPFKPSATQNVFGVTPQPSQQPSPFKESAYQNPFSVTPQPSRQQEQQVLSNPRAIESPFEMTGTFNKMPEQTIGPDVRSYTISDEARAEYAQRPLTKFGYSMVGEYGGMGTILSYGAAVLTGKSYNQWEEERQEARIEFMKGMESHYRKGTEVGYSLVLGIETASVPAFTMAGAGILGKTAMTAMPYAYKSILGYQAYETVKSYQEGGQRTAENVATLTLLAIPSILGKVPLKYREVPITTEAGEQIVYRGASLEIGKRSQPLIGKTSEGWARGIPRIPAESREPFSPKASPTSTTATKIMLSQLPPEESVLAGKAVGLVRSIENTMSNVKGTLPIETKSLPPKALNDQYNFIIKEKGVGYGSNIASASRTEELNKMVGMPGDTDVQYMATQEAIGKKMEGLVAKQNTRTWEDSIANPSKNKVNVRLDEERKTLAWAKPPNALERHSKDAHTYEDMGEAPSRMFGMSLGKPTVKRGTIEGDMMQTMPLREQAIRDLNIFNPHVVETPEGRKWTFGPEEKRMKDVLKFGPDVEQLIRSGMRTEGSRASMRATLEEVNRGLREKFPEAFTEQAMKSPEPPSYPRPNIRSGGLLESLSMGASRGYSPSASPSQQPSTSISPSPSRSKSPSRSPSPSFSPSQSPSRSPSFSFSPSRSPSPSPSLSPSISMSPSPSLSPSPSIGRGTPKRPPKIMFPFEGEKSKKPTFKVKSNLNLKGIYTPSLAGIASGVTIRKIPKGTLTGLEPRFPVYKKR